MARTKRSIAVIVACTVAALVPSVGQVSAEAPYPLAVLTSYPPANANGLATCEFGTVVGLDGNMSIDPAQAPLSYEWTTPLGVTLGFDADVDFPCNFDGTIEVSLRVITETGFDDTAKLRIASNKPPVAVVSAGGRSIESVDVAVGSSVTLSGAASYDPDGGAVTYEWESPNYPISSAPGEPLTTVTCDQEGLYAILLIVEDNFGLKAPKEAEVNCYVPASAAFTPAPAEEGERTVVALGQKVTFTPTAPKGASDRQWRTTGVPGVASTDYRFSRTFDKLGNFGVQLTESNEFGRATQWAGFTVIGRPTVSVTPAPARPKDRMTIMAGSTMTFDGSGSRSPGGGSLTYEWRTTGKSGVVADSRSYSRRFDTPGNFGVELTVVNELGQKARRWVGLTVVAAKPPTVSVTPAPADPKARMTVERGKTITFDGRASTDPDGGALTYTWRTTGVPGVAATTGTFTRRFDKVGNFGVELTVIDDEGQRAKRWVGITVVR